MLDLVPAVFLHAVAGIGLAALVWGVGLGVLRLAGRPPEREDVVYAYPVGLLAVMLAAIALLVSWWLAPLAVLLVVAPLALLFRGPRPAVASWWRPVAYATPAIGCVGIILGLLFHGPTTARTSAAYGDMLFYVDKLVSASESLVPFRDLLVEGERVIYAEGGPSYLGGALRALIGADVFLFNTTALPVFAFSSVALGLTLLRPATEPAWVRRWVPALALLVVSAVVYPTWLVESPPVALALPLALSAYRLWDAPPATPMLLAIGSVLVVDLLLTKVVALAPLGVLGLAVLAARFRSGRERALLIGVVTAAVAVAIGFLAVTAHWYAGLFRFAFLPADAAQSLADQLDVRSAPGLSPTFEIVGQVMVFAAVVRARVWALAGAVAVAVVGIWLLEGQGFDMALSAVLLLAAVSFWRDAVAFAGCRLLLLGAGAALTLAAWLRDISGVRASLVMVGLLVAAVVAVLDGGTPRVWAAYAGAAAAGLLALSGETVVGAAVAAAVAVTLVAAPRTSLWVATGMLAAGCALAAASAAGGSFGFGQRLAALTPEDHDIWSHVAAVVPADGLVFTSETGAAITGRQGWNNYPAVAGRQLYIAGWYDGALTADREEVARRLALNARVLTGALAPDRANLHDEYGSYFAVLEKQRKAPRRFRLLYENAGFALYKIP